MTTRLKTPNDIKKAFENLFDSITPEEQIEHDAQLLAFSFLSIINKEMEEKKMTRKELAKKTGTSQAYITQLFRGNRTPNLNILAKIQKALEIEFNVTTKDDKP
jgi:ribosome-binding protein aMBF1 (putative translation factor)